MNEKLVMAVGLALAGASVLGLGGCRGDRSDRPPRQLLPDMDDSPKWEPQSQSIFFADGRTMRLPVVGTVAFGESTNPDEPGRERFLEASPAVFEGKDASGGYVDFMPVELTPELLELGQKMFNITCATCHGYTGDGLGTVGQRWAYPLPTFYDPKYSDRAQRTGKDGYIFEVARIGVYDTTGAQKMPGYAHALSIEESWAVVAYIRALQATRVPIESVPEGSERSRLEGSRSAALDRQRSAAGAEGGAAADSAAGETGNAGGGGQ